MGKSEWLIELESAIDLHKRLGIILTVVERARGVPLTSQSRGREKAEPVLEGVDYLVNNVDFETISLTHR